MKTRKPVLQTLLVSFILFVVALILTSPSTFALCKAGDTYCFDPYDEMFGQPGGIFSVALIVLSLILLIVPRVFHSWLRFAKYYLPIAVVLIILSPVSDGSILGFDKEFMSWLLAGVFFIVSLILIICKQIRAKAQ